MLLEQLQNFALQVIDQRLVVAAFELADRSVGWVDLHRSNQTLIATNANNQRPAIGYSIGVGAETVVERLAPSHDILSLGWKD